MILLFIEFLNTSDDPRHSNYEKRKMLFNNKAKSLFNQVSSFDPFKYMNSDVKTAGHYVLETDEKEA